ncbi:MAG: ribosome assembly RNA-binding protein YhbY [Clostridia bacterium]|nr:ribosome assembly RNA-binding protein YhbY [Clostridia bacterium]
MFTSKERSNLRSMAQTIQPVTQVGKGGISDNLVETLSQALEARELIKVSVLNNSDEDPRDIALNLEQLLNAQIVEVKGKKIVFYRRSHKKDIVHIKF